MLTRAITSLVLLSASSVAFAAPNLATTILPPAATPYVYQNATYNVKVSNIGNHDAANVSLVIDLPDTQTSPQVYVMGILGTRSASCTLVGTNLNCSLGTIKRNKSSTVFFNIAWPESAAPLTFTAVSSTTSGEPVNQLANNTATHTPNPLNYAVSFTGPRTVFNDHCTGTGLIGYYVCTLFPSSLSSHTTEFFADGTIWYDPGTGLEYLGEWSQPTADTLAFDYYDIATGDLIAQFVGGGVGADCWEGITTFPGSTYNSAYQVCLQ